MSVMYKLNGESNAVKVRLDIPKDKLTNLAELSSFLEKLNKSHVHLCEGCKYHEFGQCPAVMDFDNMLGKYGNVCACVDYQAGKNQ